MATSSSFTSLNCTLLGLHILLISLHFCCRKPAPNVLGLTALCICKHKIDPFYSIVYETIESELITSENIVLQTISQVVSVIEVIFLIRIRLEVPTPKNLIPLISLNCRMV